MRVIICQKDSLTAECRFKRSSWEAKPTAVCIQRATQSAFIDPLGHCFVEQSLLGMHVGLDLKKKKRKEIHRSFPPLFSRTHSSCNSPSPLITSPLSFPLELPSSHRPPFQSPLSSFFFFYALLLLVSERREKWK